MKNNLTISYLYPIVNSLAWLIRILDYGITTVQLRIKKYKNIDELETNIEAAVILSKKYNAHIFINDYWQLAIKYKAYGVHLGQADMNNADINAIHRSKLNLGISVQNEIELHRALTWHPSYISIGHIFNTTTKIMYSEPKGINVLRNLISKLSLSIPIVVIGGIGKEQLKDILACNVNGIAMISAITNAKNWRNEIYEIQSIIKSWGK